MIISSNFYTCVYDDHYKVYLNQIFVLTSSNFMKSVQKHLLNALNINLVNNGINPLFWPLVDAFLKINNTFAETCV